MRQLFCIISMILVSTFCLGQETNSVDARLSEIYSANYIDNLRDNNPQLLDYLSFSLDNGYFILDDFPGDKYESLPELYKIDPATKKVVKQEITNLDLNSINILKYKFDRAADSRTYYKIGNSNKVIGFYSVNELTEKYNKYKEFK